MVRKSSLLQFFQENYGSPRMKSNSRYPSSSTGTRRGSLIKKFYPKTVAVVPPGARVTVREEYPDFKFSGTSRIQMRKSTYQDPQRSCCHVIYQIFIVEELFHLHRSEFGHKFRFGNSSQNQSQNSLLGKIQWQNFSVPRSCVVLISKFKFQNFSSLRSASYLDSTSKISSFVYHTISSSSSSSRLLIQFFLSR